MNNSELYFGLINLQILFLIVLAPIFLRNVLNIVDLKRNGIYYNRVQRIEYFKKHREIKQLVACRSCGYMCRKNWRKCPICNHRI